MPEGRAAVGQVKGVLDTLAADHDSRPGSEVRAGGTAAEVVEGSFLGFDSDLGHRGSEEQRTKAACFWNLMALLPVQFQFQSKFVSISFVLLPVIMGFK